MGGCGGNTNFCERCHQQAYSNTYYPCLRTSCTLGLPHPCISSTKGDGAVRSFVLGCSACMGCMGLGDSNQGMSANSPGQFGYPQRSWEKYAGGDVLLAALGEHEVPLHCRVGVLRSVQRGCCCLNWASRLMRTCLLQLVAKERCSCDGWRLWACAKMAPSSNVLGDYCCS